MSDPTSVTMTGAPAASIVGKGTSSSPFRMQITLNVLNHLGISLYSNVPSVLSEVVANAWDADAKHVSITVDTQQETITIEDDGHGMNENDINARYLTVGYERRKDGREVTPEFRRPVMGRKGIGKLALFAIANVVEVTSAKIEEDGSRSIAGFVMSADAIKLSIENKEPEYRPKEIAEPHLDRTKGTRIKLSGLKKGIATLEAHLRTRIARRFSVIGPTTEFAVSLNGKSIDVTDRNYFNRLEFLWTIEHDPAEFIAEHSISPARSMRIDGVIDAAKGYIVRGWVGTVKEQKQMEEGFNTITVLARGKLIHEDILKDIKAPGLFTKYVIGDLRADFLDRNELDDIATSNRQSLDESDERFMALKRFVEENILRVIGRKRKEWKLDQAEKSALDNPTVKSWFESLTRDRKAHARTLFGKIESLDIDSKEDKRELYKYGVLAFEKLALKDNLVALEKINSEADFALLKDIFAEIDEIEAMQYYQILKARIEILQKFEGLLDSAKERAIQEYLFDHLWLLDPSWERATQNARMEMHFKKEFANVKLTQEEDDARLDIKYQLVAGRHVIIELKKYAVVTNIDDLTKQVRKYKSALVKCLDTTYPNQTKDFEIICVLGSPPSPRADDFDNRASLAVHRARYITYDELIDEAQQRYREYLDGSTKTKRLLDLVNAF